MVADTSDHTDWLLERCRSFSNLGQSLNALKDEQAHGITFLTAGREGEPISYADLWREALGILGALHARGLRRDDELVFQLADERGFITCFWACLLGGILPIPVTVGFHEEFRFKLFKILEQLSRCRVIIGRADLPPLRTFCERNGLKDVFRGLEPDVLIFEELNPREPKESVNRSVPDDPALVQYSSGSTGQPKGVLLSHGNLLSNIAAMIQNAQVDGQDRALSWMPLTHDMGLVGFHLVPLVASIPQFLMPAARFLRNPVGWLGKTHKYRATLLASPNFGFRLFLDHFKRYTERNWDLSSVRLIFNGAEPISAELCEEFLDELQIYGLKRSSLFPVYGLAEACLAVTFPPVGETLRTFPLNNYCPISEKVTSNEHGTVRREIAYVDVGYPVPGCQVRIHDDREQPVEETAIGHIQIKGENVTRGYYRNPAATKEAFTDDGWLHTGDLGFMRNGRLIVTGRTKDVIFKHGVNYYSHDLERIASEIEGIGPGRIMVCGIFHEERGRNEVVAFIRFRKSLKDFVYLGMRLKRYIGFHLGLELDALVPVAKLPFTTSGKLKRHVMEENYRKGVYLTVLQDLHRLVREMEQQRPVVPPTDSTQIRLAALWKDTLGAELVGVDDNFFELGGDSLKACGLSVKIGQTFRTKISLKEIFDFQTLREMAELIDRTDQYDTTIVAPVEQRSQYPASSEQKRLFFLHQLDPAAMGYNMYMRLDVFGPLKIGKLQSSLNKLVRKREILRTVFKIDRGEPVQKVLPNRRLIIKHREIESGGIDRTLLALRKPFDLSKDQLLRIYYFCIAEERHILFLETHHAICDGTSLGIFWEELFTLYADEKLPDTVLAFRDYAVWQGDFIKSDQIGKQERYWLKKLEDGVPRFNPRTDFPRPSVRDERGGRVRFDIEQALLADLKWLARNKSTTISIVLVSIFQVLLAKHTGQCDLLVGTAMAGRNHHGLETLLGMFAKTVVLRSQLSLDEAFLKLLGETKNQFFEVHTCQDYPFEKVVDAVIGDRELSRNPIFDAMFVFQNFRIPDVHLSDLVIEEREFFPELTTFDLTFETRETATNLKCSFQYATALFREETVRRMVGHYLVLARQAAANPEMILRKMCLISKRETRQILDEFNRSETPFPGHKTLVQIFEDRVACFSERPAVVHGETTLSYDQVNSRANQLARVLRKQGVRRDTLVGLMSEPCPELILGILAILKAGGTYLPIDPDFPLSRKLLILGDSGAVALLTRRTHGEVDAFSGKTIWMDDPAIHRQEGGTDLLVDTSPRDLAYLLFTSGSTGRPKGVRVENRGLVNVLLFLAREFPSGESDTWLMKTSFTFDAAAHELFLWFFGGSKVFIAPKNLDMEPEKLTRVIIEREITHLIFVPSVLHLWNEFLTPAAATRLVRLRTVFVGGEPLTGSLGNQIMDKMPHLTLINAYGPTETTITASCEVVRFLDQHARPTIGRPIQNIQIYIFNDHGQLQPVGVPGEIFIAGVGVARGYHQQLELSRERFIEDPFQLGQTMYRSGDLGCWLPDGRIEFMGRADHQIKVRGFRIELSEIESYLMHHPEIRDAAVVDMCTPDGGIVLCGYYVSNHAKEDEVRDYLSERLPGYMLPAYLMKMEQLPMSPAGKVDRNALPDPRHSLLIRADYEPPATETEVAVIEVWQEVLQLERIGVRDHFFELGGHSLVAANTVAALGNKCGLSLGVRVLFESPVARDLAARIDRMRIKNERNAKPVEEGSLFEERLGDTLISRELRFAKRRYRVAFTDLGDRLQTLLEKSGPREDAPHYVLPADRANEIVHFKSERAFFAELGLMAPSLPVLSNQFASLVKSVRNNLTEHMKNAIETEPYPCGHHPKWFIERNLRAVFFAEFQGRGGFFVSRIQNAFNALLEKQHLLRSVLVKNEDVLSFREYREVEPVDLPIIDHGDASPEHHDRAMDLLRTAMRTELLESSPMGAPLYIPVLVRINFSEYRLLLAFDHIIADYESTRIVRYHFDPLNEPFSSKTVNYDYPVMSYRTFTEMAWLADARDKVRRFKALTEYKAFRNEVLRLQERLGRDRALVYSEPVHFSYRPPSEHPGIDAKGFGLSIAVKILARLFKIEKIPIRVLTNRRVFGGISFYNTVGDFHDSVPVVFARTDADPSQTYHALRKIERTLSDMGCFISKIGEDPEVYRTVFKSPFNFNFIGEITKRELAVTLSKANVFPFVSFPILGYRCGDHIGLILFHGIDSSCEAFLTRELAHLPGSFQLKRLPTKN